MNFQAESAAYPYPLGVHCHDDGVTVAVFSAHAERIDLCLFASDGSEQRRPLRQQHNQIFYGHFDDLKPGMAYGLRAYGPWEPAAGHKFNPQKLLLDPYARILTNTPRFHPSQCDAGESPDPQDSAPHMVKAVIPPSLGNPPPPVAGGPVPWPQSIIYEAHIKGLTQQHPDVPAAKRGRFAGLVEPAVIAHLKALGVTAVELLPIQAFISEPRLTGLGLSNYWGYNTVAFFAPHPAYGMDPDDPVSVLHEFKAMVASLHAAGIEVILDVVYNHSGEGDHLGPTLAFRGLDNHSYYRLPAADRARYANPTGCGNALDLSAPRVLQLVLDSLRYWAVEMGVDGFRFDLATTLARGPATAGLPEGGFEGRGTFLSCLMQDPVLAHKKLIMEPWDIGPDGYQLGQFPPGTAEWNDRFRDSVRAFWRGDAGSLPAFAASLAGSAPSFDHSGRTAVASINFITSHDGFTLHDLTAYSRKHNVANGEANRDGHSHNFAVNCGVEGATNDPEILAQRGQRARNLAASLLLAQGVPMWLAGDERLRSQAGNNNAYCQDNPVSWLDWTANPQSEEFQAFAAKIIALRKAEPLLRQVQFLHAAKEIGWWHPAGRLMTSEDWHDPELLCLGLELRCPERRLQLWCNAGPPVAVSLTAGAWSVRLSTAPSAPLIEASVMQLAAQSLVVLAAGPAYQ